MQASLPVASVVARGHHTWSGAAACRRAPPPRSMAHHSPMASISQLWRGACPRRVVLRAAGAGAACSGHMPTRVAKRAAFESGAACMRAHDSRSRTHLVFHSRPRSLPRLTRAQASSEQSVRAWLPWLPAAAKQTSLPRFRAPLPTMRRRASPRSADAGRLRDSAASQARNAARVGMAAPLARC